jgi:pimeloyl-ACP methyl ester carboxylesterase
MDRLVRYAQASDGVRVAYWTLGSGEPLLYMAGGPWNHIEVWDVPQCREWYERLAGQMMLVRYDVRGTGLSQREIDDYSISAQVGDLESVANELGLERFNVFAAGDAGPTALQFAVKSPQRVGRIILWCSWPRGSDFQSSPRIQAWRGLIDEDWDLMVDTCAHLAFGWDAGDVGRRAANAFRESISREETQAHLEAMMEVDVTPMLDKVTHPVLVLHRNAVSWLPVDIALRLASSIPGSRLAILEGETTAPYLGDAESVAKTISDFLIGGETGNDRENLESVSWEEEGHAAKVISAGQRNRGLVEILPFYASEGAIRQYTPAGSGSWQVNFDPERHPGEVARAALAEIGSAPTVLHSTSWRIDEDSLILTYAAVLSEPIEGQEFESVHIPPGGIAIGSATNAPESINVGEVVAHALRHLAWLRDKDEPIREALGERWKSLLENFETEPFSAFDISGTVSDEDGCMMSARYSRPLAQFVSKGSEQKIS